MRVAASSMLLATADIALAATSDQYAADTSNEAWAIHGQGTVVGQGNPSFSSPYQGANSLNSAGEARETTDVTLYMGVRLWLGAEIWINPEVDQGFGLSNTLGAAGFPSGEAYKVGKSSPYLSLQRAFIRQTIDLDGPREAVKPDLNQLGGRHTSNRLVLTVGKLSVTDIFDTNSYAHDPRGDFMNWTVIDAGTFDYAADAWGYTYGAAIEAYLGRWTLRVGGFNLSKVPNSETLETNFSQFQVDAEIEERHEIGGRAGSLKVTAFLSRGRMGRFRDAILLAQANGLPADIAAVRSCRSRAGISFNLEQEVADDVGVFLRGGVADGQVEPYEFTDVDRTASGGLSLKGSRWHRLGDTVGVALVVNGISKAHERYLDAGGLGILVGDGQLPHPGPEQIAEAYYDLAVLQALHLSLDYQFINHPAYNRDRGPVSVLSARIHGEF